MASAPRTSSTEVIDMCMSGRCPLKLSSCSNSAMCRWPVGANERMTPVRSGWWEARVGLAPPSEDPTLTSTTVLPITPARQSGHNARLMTVALQPTPLA